MLGKIASVLGALVLVRVLTEYLEPAEYGELALGLTIAGLVNAVVMGSVSVGIGRFYSIAAEKGERGGYLRASGKLLGYATLAVLVIAVVLIGGLLTTGQNQWLGLAAATLVFSILCGYNSALNGVQNAARQRAVVALHSGMDAWLKIGLAVGVMLWLGSGSTPVVIGYTLSVLVVTTSQLIFLKRLKTGKGGARDTDGNEDWAREMWQFSWPYSAWGVFVWGQQVADRWALQWFASIEEVGLYNVVFQLGYAPFLLLISTTMAFLSPIIYQRVGDARNHDRVKSMQKLVRRICLCWLVLTIVLFIVTTMFHQLIFRILVSAQYQPVSYLMPYLLVAGGLSAMHTSLNAQLIAMRISKERIPMQIISSILGITLIMAGSWMGGIDGVVCGVVLSFTLKFVWTYALVVKFAKKSAMVGY